MQEDFLHYIWQYQKLTTQELKTVQGKKLQVLAVGDHNTNSGPDFFNARIVLDNQEWAGTVEIHLKSSDWYVHSHQNDAAYDSVVLHVVWEDDVQVFDANQNVIETIVLKSVVNKRLLSNYTKLLGQKNWINCENQIHAIDGFTMSFWQEKLLVKRLQRKSSELQELLKDLQNNWEELMFLVLVKNFGLKVNSEQFMQLAKGGSFSVLKKEMDNALALEALLFGQANLLSEAKEDSYYGELQREYIYLKQKYQLPDTLVKLQFFRMRPTNFPTIRLSQLAMLYNRQRNLFSKIIATKSASEIMDLFSVSASEYWDAHYTFGKESNKRKKRVSKSFVELLIINAVIPIKFMYAKSLGKENFEDLLQLYKTIKPEKNNVVEKFKSLNVTIDSAADSQSLIELKNSYCNAHKCLQCEIGNKLLYTS